MAAGPAGPPGPPALLPGVPGLGHARTLPLRTEARAAPGSPRRRPTVKMKSCSTSGQCQHVAGNTGYKYHIVSDESESEALCVCLCVCVVLFVAEQWSLSALTKLLQQEPSVQRLPLWSTATSW